MSPANPVVNQGAAGRGTRIFGFQIPLEPKILVGILFAIVVLLGLYNFLSSDEPTGGAPRPASRAAVSPSASAPAPNIARRVDSAGRGRQGVLRIRPVDPTRGDVDPTLKLWLLDRVRAVKPITGGRNLFETAAEVTQAKLPPIPKVAPIIPKPAPVVAAAPPPPPVVNIPLRYYGFVKPTLRGDGNRGYFMDGENILMATEGDVLESRFLIVALSPNTARVEDIQLKQGQDLPLIPEAIAQ